MRRRAEALGRPASAAPLSRATPSSPGTPSACAASSGSGPEMATRLSKPSSLFPFQQKQPCTLSATALVEATPFAIAPSHLGACGRMALFLESLVFFSW